TEWLADFQTLYDYVENNYPYLAVKNRTHGYNWLDLKPMYETRIQEATSNDDFLLILHDAIKALQNRHTGIIDPNDYSEYANMLGDSFYPLTEMFSEEAANASDYWRTILYSSGSSYRQKMNRRFVASIVYDRGEYIIANPGSWNFYGDDLTVVAVNGTPIDNLVPTCFEKDYIDWDYQRNKSYLWMVSPRDFGENAIFTIRNTTGYEVDMTFNAYNGYSGFPYDHYPYQTYNSEFYEEENVAYLYISTFEWNIISNHLAFFSDFMQRIEGYDYLILDIRGNTGGNYQSWIEAIVEPLIDETTTLEAYLAYRTSEYSDVFRTEFGLTTEISKEIFEYLPPEVYTDDFKVYQYYHPFSPVNPVDFDGEIILLTDHIVYSAAEAFTLFCKQTGFATIYGTTSGGDGLMAFPTLFQLPYSKLIINFCSALGLDRTGHANEEWRTQPDVLYESEFGNWEELIEYTLTNLP
ncbi:MAG: S41 family peptidase, partial [Candidatus Thorarchaeota archaeon]